MKKILFLTLALFCAAAMSAQTTEQKMQKSGKEDKKYCAVSKSGKMQLMMNGKAVTSEVKLSDGTKVTADCSLTKKDGTKGMLKSGQCIDNMGYIMPDGRTGMNNTSPGSTANGPPAK